MPQRAAGKLPLLQNSYFVQGDINVSKEKVVGLKSGSGKFLAPFHLSRRQAVVPRAEIVFCGSVFQVWPVDYPWCSVHFASNYRIPSRGAVLTSFIQSRNEAYRTTGSVAQRNRSKVDLLQHTRNMKAVCMSMLDLPRPRQKHACFAKFSRT